MYAIKPLIASLALVAVPVFAASTPCGDAAPASPMSLATSLDYALCHQPQTRSAWAQLRAQQASVDIAQAAYSPNLSASASLNRSQSDDGSGSTSAGANLNLSYLLFDFGQRDAQLTQARALLDASRASVDNTLASVWLDTVRAYFNVGKAGKQIDAYKAAEEAAKASLDAADKRAAVGTATPLDVLQAKATLAQATLNRTKAQNDLATSKGALAKAMGISPMQLPVLSDMPTSLPDLPLAESKLDKLLDAAVRERPEVRSALANLAAADASLHSAQLATKPTLSLSAGLGVNRSWPDSEARSSGSIGLSLSIPFDLSGATKARTVQAEAQRDASAAQLESARQGAENDAWQAFYSLRSALDTLAAAKVVQENASKAYDAALKRYKAGLDTLLDVLSAQNTLASAEQQQVAARYDWYAARASLAWALGGQLPNQLSQWAPPVAQ